MDKSEHNPEYTPDSTTSQTDKAIDQYFIKLKNLDQETPLEEDQSKLKLTSTKNLEAITNPNPEIKVETPKEEGIITSLSKVSPSAIQRYAKAVGKAFDIPKELRTFVAYFCKVEHEIERYTSGEKEGRLMLRFDTSMLGRDYKEALRNLLNNPDNQTIKTLTGKDITEIIVDKEVIIDTRLIPEYGKTNEIIGLETYSIKTSQFIELMKIPQQGRTFYAGVIDYWLTHHTAFNKLKKRRVSLNDDSKIPILNVSTEHVVEYAKSVGITDYAQYVSMLKDNA